MALLNMICLLYFRDLGEGNEEDATPEKRRCQACLPTRRRWSVTGEARARRVGRPRLGHPNFVIAKLMAWFEDEFLDAPIQEFGDVELVCGGAGDFVNPAELAKLLAGFAEGAEEFPVEREFVDTAGESVGGVENLTWSWRNANGPCGAGRHR